MFLGPQKRLEIKLWLYCHGSANDIFAITLILRRMAPKLCVTWWIFANYLRNELKCKMSLILRVTPTCPHPSPPVQCLIDICNVKSQNWPPALAHLWLSLLISLGSYFFLICHGMCCQSYPISMVMCFWLALLSVCH